MLIIKCVTFVKYETQEAYLSPLWTVGFEVKDRGNKKKEAIRRIMSDWSCKVR